MISPHALSFYWGFSFLHVFPCVGLLKDNERQTHVRKGFWLVRLKGLAGWKENAVDAGTALISDTCAILHCRSDVDELAECVMCCAWALKFLRSA